MVLWLIPSQWKTTVTCLLCLRSATCKGQNVRLPLLPIKPSLWRRRRESSSLSSSSTIPSCSPCLEYMESPDANLDYLPFYESVCQDIHRIMSDLGGGIHTVGPGMESLSHGSLGLFPVPNNYRASRADDRWLRQRSVPVYLTSHTAIVGTNPTLNHSSTHVSRLVALATAVPWACLAVQDTTQRWVLVFRGMVRWLPSLWS